MTQSRLKQDVSHHRVMNHATVTCPLPVYGLTQAHYLHTTHINTTTYHTHILLIRGTGTPISHTSQKHNPQTDRTQTPHDIITTPLNQTTHRTPYLTVLSQEPDMAVRPSGVMPTDMTSSEWPFRVFLHSPVSISHTLRVQ